jgi:hypothetical protein
MREMSSSWGKRRGKILGFFTFWPNGKRMKKNEKPVPERTVLPSLSLPA